MSAVGRERVAHVLRRLGMGPSPDLLADLRTTDDAIARALDLSAPAPTPPAVTAPVDYDSGRGAQSVGPAIEWWIEQMRSSPRLIEERLVWFWHDHFATGIQKVQIGYLMWNQHLTIRQHATGSFADLLKAVSKDPAMLVYLDGATNVARNPNENFGREVMELFTVGRDEYSQADVLAASRAFTGWAVNLPGRAPAQATQLNALGIGPWRAGFVPQRHDNGTKTFLGVTANLDMDRTLDVLLDRPTTAPRLAGKLYAELVGRTPDDKTKQRLGKVLRDSGWSIMALVTAITEEKAFTSDAAVRSKVRTPVEKVVAMLQAFPTTRVALGQFALRGNVRNQRPSVGRALATMGYFPFAPPNVAGFPKGASLLGPHQLVHTFDLLSVYPSMPSVPAKASELLARFGLFDVSDRTRDALTDERDLSTRLALTVGAPEMVAV